LKHKINTAIFITLFGLEIYFFRSSDLFPALLVGTALLFLAIIGIGVVFIRLSYFVPTTSRLKGDKVLLTFDDGPDPDNTQKILGILNEHNIGAFFFLIGNKIEANKGIVEEIIREGHMIGNHSYSHNNFMAFYSTKALINDFTKTEEILDSLSKDRSRFFRPPIGYTTPNYTRALKRLNLKCIGWRLRTYDTLTKDPGKLISRLVRTTKKGDIVLFHDNLNVTLECLPKYIAEAKQNGIIFVSKDEVKNVL
jgi:peptidoglycan/xylan/chitin deacetylase (PgdA/CDA1 family)